MRFVLVSPKAYTYGCVQLVKGGKGCTLENGIAGGEYCIYLVLK